MATAPDGRAVFVRHTLPGERVLARITEERPRYLRADAVQVLAASADRVVPPCPAAGPGRCGGCDFQHVALPAQRALKADLVREQLARLAGIEAEVTVEEVPGAPDGLGWRTRVAFAVRADGVVGLHRHRSHQVEPLTGCPIAHPLVEDLGLERHRWPGAKGVAVHVGPASGDRAVLVTPAGRRRPRNPRLDAPAAVRLAGPGAGAARVRERLGDREFTVRGGGFWQVHPGAGAALTAAVVAALQPRPGERALDLYAGAGLFAAALADRVGPAGAVRAVEGDRQAAADARRNLADLSQVEVRAAAVDPATVAGLGSADVVVLDPPRRGAGPDVVTALAELAPRAVAYVACDPASLGRDLAAFAGHGYRLDGLRAFDLFPMTEHVECVAHLVPAGAA